MAIDYRSTVGPDSAYIRVDEPVGDEAVFHDHPEIADVMVTNARVLSKGSDSASEPTVIPAYTYGGAAPFVFGGTGMLSNAEILLWVQSHSSAVSDQLRERMENADIRNKIVQDLTHLKSLLKRTEDSQPIKDQAAELVAAYEGTPFADEVRAAVAPILNDKDETIDAAELQKATGSLDAAIDKFGKDDQYDMIYIQDLTSRIREFISAGSNMMSSNHQTMMAILGNIGR